MRAMGNSTPVLMLTAKAEVEDRVSGLDAGADDYLTKPFAMKELIARVRALTRRQSRHGPTVLRYADLTLNTEALELSSESSVRLSMKESELMAFFLQNPERSFTTADLFSRIWPDEPGLSEDVVYLYVSYLRTKLRAVASRVGIRGSRGGEYACQKE
jgi:DNA-binding response OmpR family regulator